MISINLFQVGQLGLIADIVARSVVVSIGSIKGLLQLKSSSKVTAKKSKQKSKKIFKKSLITQYVVLAYNNQSSLELCLNSIAATKPTLPIIVINNGSSDNTAYTAKTFIKSHKNTTKFSYSSKRAKTTNQDILKQIAKKTKASIFIVLSGDMNVPRVA